MHAGFIKEKAAKSYATGAVAQQRTPFGRKDPLLLGGVRFFKSVFSRVGLLQPPSQKLLKEKYQI
jgi:hypothetical protein